MAQTSPDTPNRRQPFRILCVDNNTLVGEALYRLLSVAGHEVERVNDGEEAWDKMSNDIGQYEVVITDHDMPRMNGLALVRWLRQVIYRGRIIVHSPALSPSDLAEYHDLGVDSIIVKASAPEEVLDVVESFYGSSDPTEK